MSLNMESTVIDNMSMIPAILLLSLAAGGLCWLYLTATSSIHSSSLPLPPGPSQLPFVGNLHQTPQGPAWETYQKWSMKYGPIMLVKNGTVSSIIINSFDIVKSHLQRKNAIYSHRQSFPFFERVGGGLNAAVMPYGPQWKLHRAWRNSVLKQTMTNRYRPLQEVEARQLLHEFLHKENVFTSSLRRFSASVFLTIAYGTRETTETEEIHQVEDAVRRIAYGSENAFSGRSMLSQFFPSLLGWLPAQWKSDADQLHQTLHRIHDRRMREALRTPTWNWAKHYCQMAKGLPFKELTHAVGTIYEGAFSPYQVLRIIILAAVLHPDAARRVQEELDRVVGNDRLPGFSDSPQLPFLNAFIKEALRWRPFFPLGAPRAAFQDDECMGYRIPRESIVVVNDWGIGHDETVFPSPYEFDPERWVADPNLPEIMFGFGQRGCPGRYLGYDSVFIVAACIFWAFNMNCGPEGIVQEEMMKSEGDSSFFSAVPEFQATFEVRDELRRKVIEDQWLHAEKDSDTLLEQMMGTHPTA
ncbi:unnamed protein product [Penicillium nalgiovense]|uniref:Cytochrome P450 n=2 Tax=Penicillium nalgiovense TaxID=60175 RepID=A0A9W4H9N0_PENNA|nr:unnamed protein product [Penicillium nalgiovense]CAG7938627.1 unnamed protein product [Penicillium nalgiovense]CAG7940432.1 unnamed protein product [Penicillium nalgiovense]CAG7940576.1 unnamed protein product [Penicillium nalgiovense]CAG7940983.1 unnamed protein product [Penicillium nalgiovense]